METVQANIFIFAPIAEYQRLKRDFEQKYELTGIATEIECIRSLQPVQQDMGLLAPGKTQTVWYIAEVILFTMSREDADKASKEIMIAPAGAVPMAKA